MSNQLYQRAVYASLRRMTSNRSLIKNAYVYWQKTLSHQEFDILQIVTELVSYLDLSVQEKKTLMISLHSTSNKLLDELPPVPGIIEQSDALDDDEPSVSTPQTRVKTSPQQLVTQRYMQLFAQYMQKSAASEFTEFRQALAKEGLDDIAQPLAQTISSWASNGMADLKLPDDIDESDCKSLAHETYLFASEFVGPNVADNIVLKAIDGCLDMDESTRFDPRNFT